MTSEASEKGGTPICHAHFTGDIELCQGPYRALRGWVNGLGYPPVERLMPYLELAGFGLAVLIQMFDLRYDLISALIECWHSKTHTFHLSCGEHTVTLEDVALQLWLPIDGSAITSNVRLYSWGSTILVMLYCELCRTTKPDAVDIVWDNRMVRRSQMDISFDLQPSLEYIQWYFSTRKSYLLGEQSTVVSPHMYRLGVYEPEPELEPELEPKPEPKLEPKPEPEPELELD
ncbi:hypothetical protein J1N35_015053 [Gossypium stocksii]|uniref:Aminotransferase-like plant mobile domain-containing protein n=1 Tax=Gossypium stocksii TaxID=47602 RepID=A0A9D3VVF7_9ROSI|nr:hypothetical protein J1N35_015053 [Gossypium stocksii]